MPDSTLICFRCRRPLPDDSTHCPHCDVTDPPSSTYPGDSEDPESIRIERAFLLDAALEVSNPEGPTFLVFSEDELVWRHERIPPLPLGKGHLTLSHEEDTELTLRKLTMGENWERGQAAIRLGQEANKPPQPELVMKLLRRLSDRDNDVRVCVLWALGKMTNMMLLPPLLEMNKLETDVTVRPQLAATLWHILGPPERFRKQKNAITARRIEELTADLRQEPTADKHFLRGRAHLNTGQLLKGAGDFSRALELGLLEPHTAYLFRSQSFLLMGKPLFALDDLLLCPRDEEYPALFHFHKATLMALAKQIVNTAREKGLNEYARLFERRLERL